MKRIGVVAKRKDKRALSMVAELINWAKEKGFEVIVEERSADLISYDKKASKSDLGVCDLIVIFGGDGTLLSVARETCRSGVPILGVNLGGLGFLTEIAYDELYDSLEVFFSGKAFVQKRMMLEANIFRGGERFFYVALNDVVIERGARGRIVELETKIGGEYLTTYRADGLIVSTPTGSTAYSLSAGGPIVYPGIDVITITPICPHMLTNRPLIIPDTMFVEVKVQKFGRDDEVVLICDGQVGGSIVPGDHILIKKSSYHTYIVRSPKRSYYEILRTKLKWGQI